MKKIIIIPGNTDLNRGDQALVWESIHLIEDVYGKNNVSCMIMSEFEGTHSHAQNCQTAKLGYKFVNTLLKHPGRKFTTKEEDRKGYSMRTLLHWGLQAISDYIHTRLLLSDMAILRSVGELFLNQKEKETLKDIKGCDAVYVKGGGFIHSYGSISDPYFIYYLTYHIRLAEAYGKKVFLLPNSIGPLKNSIAREIALRALRKCTFVSVRENISKGLLKKMKVEAHFFPDLGFYLKPSSEDMSLYLHKHNVPLGKRKVIVTLRPYRFQGYNNAERLYANYVQGFSTFLTYLYDKGYHVSFMAHTLGPSSHEDDRLAIKDVMDNLPDKIRENTSYIEDFALTCTEVEKIYSYYDYMIGTRFHSVIFSLNVGVPSIAIAYGGNKSKGIMNVLGNEDYSLDMDKVNGKRLISMFEELVTNKVDYLTNLAQKKFIIDEQRGCLVEKIRSLA